MSYLWSKKFILFNIFPSAFLWLKSESSASFFLSCTCIQHHSKTICLAFPECFSWMKIQLYLMNRHKLGKINLKKNSLQCIHTCCFGVKVRMCVVEAVLQKKLEGHINWFIFTKVSDLLYVLTFQGIMPKILLPNSQISYFPWSLIKRFQRGD